MAYQNTWEERGVYRKYTGLLTGKLIRESVDEVEGDGRFDSIRYVINDYLAVTGMDVTDFELQAIAAIDSAASAHNKKIIIAQVSTRQDIISLVTGYDDNLQDNTYQTKIFSTLADARKWIEDEE